MGIHAVELFAGVGGFRLGLRRAGIPVVWSNQWEPGKKTQWASDCYVRNFGADGHVNDDVAKVAAEQVPDHDILVGGFPCQDYSVATTLSKATGLEGKKGVLWWEIYRIAKAKSPRFLLLENVDRLLKSPADQRGRDFAVILWCLSNLGYAVEWRVINAADYGFPQKRRRTFIFASKKAEAWGAHLEKNAPSGGFLAAAGFFAGPFPARQDQMVFDVARMPDVVMPKDVLKLSQEFRFEFENAGVCVDGRVWTQRLTPNASLPTPLRAILEQSVPEEYFIPDEDVPKWKYLKGAKREKRTAKNGYAYEYAEGSIPFPDSIDEPARTLLTSEGGISPSRFKHLITDSRTGRLRVLTPVECERLDGFPDGWTSGMPAGWRYFCMGNALVVGLVERMGERILAHVPKNSEKHLVKSHL